MISLGSYSFDSHSIFSHSDSDLGVNSESDSGSDSGVNSDSDSAPLALGEN